MEFCRIKLNDMDKTILISLPIEDLQAVIIDCVNSCLKNHGKVNDEIATVNDRWFDIKELCEYLPDKPAKPTVYSWVHSGAIPCHKGQKKLRFLKSEIDSWLAMGKKKTIAEIAKQADNYLRGIGNK